MKFEWILEYHGGAYNKTILVEEEGIVLSQRAIYHNIYELTSYPGESIISCIRRHLINGWQATTVHELPS